MAEKEYWNQLLVRIVCRKTASARDSWEIASILTFGELEV